MNEDDLFMNDTLDNFTFSGIKSQNRKGRGTSEEISFDDSSFLNGLSLELEDNEKFEENKCLDNSEQKVLRENNKNFKINQQHAESFVKSIKLETSPKIFHISPDKLNKPLQKKRYNTKTTKYDFGKPVTKENIQPLVSVPVHKQKFKSDQNNKATITRSPKLEQLQHNELTNISNNQSNSNYDNTNVSCEKITVNPSNKNYDLTSWGLPEVILEKYKSKKIEKMFPWQVECLCNPKVLNELSNLIYSAPTSAGKTLVAEILALKTIFERNKKVIFILPFVSIVREKMYYFQDILASSGIRAEGFMGSYNPPGGFSSIQLAICTIEKANSLVNRLLEEGRLSEIGAILVDEMHLLGDPHRGYLLELLLTKLRYISLKDNNVQIQIIGMSATLPNLHQLAKWLGAELYSTSFRPIPLHEQAIVCGEIYDKNLKLVRKLERLPELGVDTDHILQLCLETIKDSCSVLIFCPYKNWCENLAQQLSIAFLKVGNTQTAQGELLRSQIKSDLILEVLEQLKCCPIGLDQILHKTVSFGVAFHHAGLTMDERDIIEGAFRNGAIRILVATSTLSSGVNLPARRVLIRSPNFHGKPIDLLTYRQMIGRAGRMGKDTVGESFLICQKSDYKIAKELMSGKLPAVESCLEGAGKLKRAILEVIASGVASSPGDVTLFTNCTLLAVAELERKDFDDPISEAVSFLKNNEFIRLQRLEDGKEKYVATSLGKACLFSSVAPDEGLALFTELEKARQCFVLETELHLIYLVTPYSACYSWGNIDWMFYLDLWDKLPVAMKRVGELVGVRESYIVNATRGRIDTNSSKGNHRLMVHKRFFIALALQDLVNEIPLGEVCAKFSCNRGMLQSLQQSASTFAGMVTSFSRQLGWSSVEILLSQFQDRMQFGVSRDLLDLMHLPSLNGKIARSLYNAGLETVIQLANSNLEIVENILFRAAPFHSSKERDGESEFDNKQRNKLRTVWVTGKEGLTEREAAELLVIEARNYLKIEMGLKDAKWNNHDTVDATQSQESQVHKLPNNEDPKETSPGDENPSSEPRPKKTEENKLSVLEDAYSAKNASDSNEYDVSGTTSLSSLILNISSELHDVSLSENVATLLEYPCNKDVLLEHGDIVLEEKSENSEESIKIFLNNDMVSKKLEDQSSFKEDSEEKFKNSEETNKLLNNNIMSKKRDDQISFDFNISNSSSVFSDISFTRIEENIRSHNTELEQNLLLNQYKSNRNKKRPCEVSDILRSSSPMDLNISDFSVFSSFGNKSRSDQSLIEDSFSLQLSDESAENKIKSPCSEAIEDFESEGLFEMAVKDIKFSQQIGDNEKIFNLNLPKNSKLSSESLIRKESCNLNLANNNKVFLNKRSRDSSDSGSGDSFLEATPTKKSRFLKELNTPLGSTIKKVSRLSLSDNVAKNINTDFSKMNIVCISNQDTLIDKFFEELKDKKYFAFSTACSRVEENKQTIGANIISNNKKSISTKQEKFIFKGKKVEGFAICWGDADAYFLSTENPQTGGKVVKLLKQVFADHNLSIRMFSAKEHLKALKLCCEIDFFCKIEDPKVADWLLDAEFKEKSLQAMVRSYCKDLIDMSQLCGNSKGVGSIGLDLNASVEPKMRASVEAIVTWHLVDALNKELLKQMPRFNKKISETFPTTYDLEMRTILCIANMEVTGMSASKTSLQNLVDLLKNHQNSIERNAYSLAGRRFNFASSADISKVIGMYKGKKVSTRKQVLEQSEHPISDLVLQWRKINYTLTKMVYPLIRSCQNGRIYGCYDSYTATGRITMHEPNIQMVTKDFSSVDPITKKNVVLSCRSVFSVPEGYLLVSADYCQLELRILTYLSKDKLLMGIMDKPGDIFKSIAAKWNNVTEDIVDDNMRQNAKQLCYGIIYGMGAKTLAEQLDISEDDATHFMESFRNTYSGIKDFIKKTVDLCRENGYVETITGRRRYLPHIHHVDSSLKSQAERQAVNTTVQGSAADIVKNAMIVTEDKLNLVFKKTRYKPKLTLHLHDELIYEVPEKYLEKTVKVIRKGMENSAAGLGHFPVKVKTGKSWGGLTEYSL